MPRVTEITRFSDTVVAKGHALLSSHKMEIISAGLIFLYLHNISVVEQHGWAFIIDTAFWNILIIKGNSCPVSRIHLAWLNDWHFPSQFGFGWPYRHGKESNDVRDTSPAHDRVTHFLLARPDSTWFPFCITPRPTSVPPRHFDWHLLTKHTKWNRHKPSLLISIQ